MYSQMSYNSGQQAVGGGVSAQQQQSGNALANMMRGQGFALQSQQYQGMPMRQQPTQMGMYPQPMLPQQQIRPGLGSYNANMQYNNSQQMARMMQQPTQMGMYGGGTYMTNNGMVPQASQQLQQLNMRPTQLQSSQYSNPSGSFGMMSNTQRRI